jgi:nitroreductase
MDPGMDARGPMAGRAEVDDTVLAAEWAAALIRGRRTVLPKRLAAPGPDARQLQQILGAAADAPDHMQLLPWRFVLVPAEARARLAEVFAQSLRERDPQAGEEQLAQAREKAFRAPLLLLAIARTDDEQAREIPPLERLVSAGCAIQNMLLMATAQGFGSALTSGKALQSAALRELFSLAPGEHALCFINIGTVAARKPGRERPPVERYVSRLELPS